MTVLILQLAGLLDPDNLTGPRETRTRFFFGCPGSH